MPDSIALLGWGSLLWEGGSAFDAWHEPWIEDGPPVKIEFSRVSASRGGALTLVIDPDNGAPIGAAYCLSRRLDIAEAIEDLRLREGTTAKNIGWLRRTGQANYRDRESYESIRAWAREHGFQGVVWTDLPSNFAAKAGRPFSVEAALAYLGGLDPKVREDALDYIRKAPPFVRTPLRDALAARIAAETGELR